MSLVRMRSYWSRMGLLKRGNLDMDPHRGRMPGEQGTPKTARKPAEARREAWNGSALTVSEGTKPPTRASQTPPSTTVRLYISVV